MTSTTQVCASCGHPSQEHGWPGCNHAMVWSPWAGVVVQSCGCTEFTVHASSELDSSK